MELLLASTNKKKLAELEALLTPLGVRVLTPADVGGLPEVIEDQPDFAGNARKKALSGATHTNRWTLADDSGLEVDALDGAPGVFSARYSGPEANDQRNNEKLLSELARLEEAGAEPLDRSARFVCALCLTRPKKGDAEAGSEVVLEIEGQVRGEILTSARGTGGFGYDPLFLFTEPGHAATGTCFAELAQEEKSRISHRGRALQAMAEKLLQLF